MNIDIQARDFSLTGHLKKEVGKRIIRPLAERYDRIHRIYVRLGDLNGPRGGKDKYCRIKVDIPGKKFVYVENVDSDLYSAIYKAAERVNRTVSRRLSRFRQRPIRYRNRQTEEPLIAYNV